MSHVIGLKAEILELIVIRTIWQRNLPIDFVLKYCFETPQP
jgi:hypothetical protein